MVFSRFYFQNILNWNWIFYIRMEWLGKKPFGAGGWVSDVCMLPHNYFNREREGEGDETKWDFFEYILFHPQTTCVFTYQTHLQFPFTLNYIHSCSPFFLVHCFVILLRTFSSYKWSFLLSYKLFGKFTFIFHSLLSPCISWTVYQDVSYSLFSLSLPLSLSLRK